LLEEAERVAGLDLGAREDLTHIPIVAIDPADARDHDDAVWAAPDDDPANPAAGRRSSPLRTSASTSARLRARQGSAQARQQRLFPDRVVPMLPGALSAHVCSLVEGEDRAALACHLQGLKGRSTKKLAVHPRPRPHRGQHRLRGTRRPRSIRLRPRRHPLQPELVEGVRFSSSPSFKKGRASTS
jgi:hypothetical protein